MVARAHAHGIAGCGLALVLALGACEGREPAPAPTPGPTPAAPSGPRGKAELFGDASLVPTRAGERARRELALAGELERALTRLGLIEVHVDVELHGPEQPPAVIVIATAPTRASAAPDPTPDPTPDPGPDPAPHRWAASPSEAEILELGAALIPTLTGEHLHLWLRPSLGPEPEPSGPSGPGERPWALLLTCLGLGLSLGVTGERLRARW